MIRALPVIGLALLVMVGAAAVATGQGSQTGVPAPELGQGAWINSAPLSMAGLRGRVVVVEFWTYG